MSTQTSAKRRVRPQIRTARDSYWKRQGIRSVLWGILPLGILGGWLYRPLGFIVLLCMGASIGLSFKRGRTFCDFCPRGTFSDIVMSRVGRGRPIPKFLRSLPFRIFMLALLMGMMTSQLIRVWGDAARMGMVFWLLLTVTTAVGIILAIPFNSRTWRGFCPMGSMAS